MHWSHVTLIALGTFWCTGVPVSCQLPNLDVLPICTLAGCGASTLRCGPDSTVPSCNPTTGECYCLEYQCDNDQNKCNSTVCSDFERAECILNKYGTRCKCIPLITSTYCNTENTACSLRYINQSDLQHFGAICQNLGQDYFAETCRQNGECRCAKTSTDCTVTSCESTGFRCGPDQTVPQCDTTSRQCYCLNYQCDNLDKNCSSTDCGLLQRSECVLDKYGTSCKCILDSNLECDRVYSPACNIALNQAEIQRFDNICGQLGGTYFPLRCSATEQCRCAKKFKGCRTNSDCPCARGEVGGCDVQRQTCFSFCSCRSDAQCAQTCPSGQTSRCPNGHCTICTQICSSDSDCNLLNCPADKPIRKCSTISGCYCDIDRCTSRSQCPDCTDSTLKKTCRQDDTCGCLPQQSCQRNEDCTRSNGLNCDWLNLNPSCCWTGCGDTVCRCRQSGLFGCSQGGSGFEIFTHC